MVLVEVSISKDGRRRVDARTYGCFQTLGVLFFVGVLVSRALLLGVYIRALICGNSHIEGFMLLLAVAYGLQVDAALSFQWEGTFEADKQSYTAEAPET